MNKFLITIALKGGISGDHCVLLKDYFDKRFDAVVVNVETHKSGLYHLHGYVETKVTRAAVRNHLSKYLKDVGHTVGPKTLNVKSADAGARQYVVKDVTEDQPVTLCKGWSIESLLAERREALKKLSRKEVMGNWKVIGQDEAVPLMLKFAASHSMIITDKHSFIKLGIEMMREKYDFSRVKMSALYAQVMVQMGDDHAAEDWFENQLIGLR